MLPRNRSSASLSADIVPVVTTSSGPGIVADKYTFVNGFNSFYSDWLPSFALNQIAYNQAANTVSGISICVNGDGVKRHAIISLGARKADGTSTNVEIRSGSCPA